MPSLLLHICCGPCAIMPIMRLRNEGFAVLGWFMNPNIHPLAEYLRRREAAAECAARSEIELQFDDDWNIASWLEWQLPFAQSKERCQRCCAQRLEACARKAVSLGIEHFTSTLLYSRYQPHDFIRECGEKLAQTHGLNFVYRDFRTDWQAGIDLSRNWGLYRQPYCGCILSEAERYEKKLARLQKTSPLTA
ncbi:MAG: epoxyqueuosine reductase QueH [Desulfovibrio sp.]|nr:epoxyqueuosine reductase QueH [Desulfovibrio sp.]